MQRGRQGHLAGISPPVSVRWVRVSLSPRPADLGRGDFLLAITKAVCNMRVAHMRCGRHA